MVRGKVFALLIIALVLAGSSLAVAEVEEDTFFSFERFFLNEQMPRQAKGDGRIQNDLKRFYEAFNDGLYAMSAGRFKEAEKSFLKARGIWPEYFGTDFLLAMDLEQAGDVDLAARYYKSYLNKLKALYSGNYRISGPLMVSLTPTGVENYSLAQELVKKRLEDYGIDIDRVRPVITVPGFFMPLLAGFLLVILYVSAKYMIIPYFKFQYRLKHPPEGFWICAHCGADNPNPAKECVDCRRPRLSSKEKGKR
ncbi:MAG: hypothetical protein P9L88_06610 [Candidatus Tantalella remota]|nr:hypothetical protein [Candidatus Tantalella remota]